VIAPPTLPSKNLKIETTSKNHTIGGRLFPQRRIRAIDPLFCTGFSHVPVVIAAGAFKRALLSLEDFPLDALAIVVILEGRQNFKKQRFIFPVLAVCVFVGLFWN
jgi:hypothetical protein